VSIPFAMWVDLSSHAPRGFWAVEGAMIGRVVPRDALVVRGASGAQVRTKVRAITSVPRGAEGFSPAAVVIDACDPLLPSHLIGGVATEPGLLVQAFWSRVPAHASRSSGATFDLDDGLAHGLYRERAGIATMIVVGGMQASFERSLHRLRLSSGENIERAELGAIERGWAVTCFTAYERAGELVMITAPSGPGALDAPVNLVGTRNTGGRVLSQQRNGRLQVQSDSSSDGANLVVGPAIGMAA